MNDANSATDLTAIMHAFTNRILKSLDEELKAQLDKYNAETHPLEVERAKEILLILLDSVSGRLWELVGALEGRNYANHPLHKNLGAITQLAGQIEESKQAVAQAQADYDREAVTLSKISRSIE